MKIKTYCLLFLLCVSTNNYGMNNNVVISNQWINTTAFVDFIKKHPLTWIIPASMLGFGMLYKYFTKPFIFKAKISKQTSTNITTTKDNSKNFFIITAFLTENSSELLKILPQDIRKEILLSYLDDKVTYLTIISAIKRSTLSQPCVLPDIDKNDRSYNNQYGIEKEGRHENAYYKIYKLLDNANNNPLITTTQKLLGENESVDQGIFFNTTNNILFIHHTKNTSNYNITVYNLDNNKTKPVTLPTSLDLSRNHYSIKIHPSDSHIFIPFTDSNNIEIFSLDNLDQNQSITLQGTNTSINHNGKKYSDLIFDKTGNQIAVFYLYSIVLYDFNQNDNIIQKLAASERITNDLSRIKFNAAGTHILGIPISGAAARTNDSYNNYAYLGEIDIANQTIKDVIPKNKSFYYIYDLKNKNECFLSCSSPGSITLYNYSNKTLTPLNPDLKSESTKKSLWNLAMSNDKKYCATLDSNNSNLLLINIIKNKARKATIPYKHYQLFFHPHYPILAEVKEGGAKLYDKKLNCIKTIPQNKSKFAWPYFSQSGESITLNETSYQLYSLKPQRKNVSLLENSQREKTIN